MLKLSPVFKKIMENRSTRWRVSSLYFGGFRVWLWFCFGFFCEVFQSPTYNPITNECSISWKSGEAVYTKLYWKLSQLFKL